MEERLRDIIESKIIDKWTPVHVASGFALAKLTKRNLPLGIAALVGFEIIENQPATRAFLKETLGFRGKETADNVVSDIIAGIAGFVAEGLFDD